MPPPQKLKDYTPPKAQQDLKYPFDEWLDGGTYRIRRGKKGHFTCTLKSMEHLLRYHIRRRNIERAKAGQPAMTFSIYKEFSPEALVILPR